MYMDLRSIRAQITMLKLRIRQNTISKETMELQDEMDRLAPIKRTRKLKRPRITPIPGPTDEYGL